MTWPGEGRGTPYYQRTPPPTCREGGTHRWGALHFLTMDRTVTVRVCRYCDLELVRRFVVKDGKLVSVKLDVKDSGS